MKSTWDLIMLPDALRVLFTTVAMALAFAPFFPGLKIGGLEVPKLIGRAQQVMRTVGPLCFALIIGAFIPVWSTATAHISNCGFYRDQYGPSGEWQPYDPVSKGKERFWIACHITANIPLTIESVLTPVGLVDDFFVGLNPQKLEASLVLFAKQSEWLAVPVELSMYSDAMSHFRTRSQIKFKLRDSNVWLIGNLPPLIMPIGQDKGVN
jgi:hypothetical protein